MPALLIEELITLLVVLVGLAMAALQHGVSKGFVSWLVNVTRRIPLFGGVSVDMAVQLTRWVTHSVGGWWKGLEPSAAAWFGGIVQWVQHVLWQALIWPYWLLRATEWIIHVQIPLHARAAVTHVTKLVRGTVRVVTKETRVIYRIPHLTRSQIKAAIAAVLGGTLFPYLPILRWLRAHFHALSHAIAHAPALPRFPDITGLRKRVGRLEHRLAPLALGAAALAALARVGLGWLRCRNVTKVGKSVCGFDSSLLDSLLLDGVAIFSVMSVVEFARELRAVEDEALGIASKLIREWPS